MFSSERTNNHPTTDPSVKTTVDAEGIGQQYRILRIRWIRGKHVRDQCVFKHRQIRFKESSERGREVLSIKAQSILQRMV